MLNDLYLVKSGVNGWQQVSNLGGFGYNGINWLFQSGNVNIQDTLNVTGNINCSNNTVTCQNLVVNDVAQVNSLNSDTSVAAASLSATIASLTTITNTTLTVNGTGTFNTRIIPYGGISGYLKSGEGGTVANAVYTTGNQTISGVKTFANQIVPISGISGYGGVTKIYRANVTQVGTSNPTATTLENTLGGTGIWMRAAEGEFTLTCTGAFSTADKVFLLMRDARVDTGGALRFLEYAHTSSDVLTFTQRDAGETPQDGWNSPIQILVYP